MYDSWWDRSRRRVRIVAWVSLVTIAGGMAFAPLTRAADERVASPPVLLQRMNEALLPGNSMSAKARVHTNDGYGGESELVLQMLRKDMGEAQRTLIEVLEPAEGRGTVYEIVARPGQELERWVWLPELRRLRKIIGIHRTDPFLGTEFTYEDLGLAAPVERGRGEAEATTVDGRSLVRIEAPAYHYYGRVITLLDPKTYLPVEVRFFDQKGALFRVQRFTDVATVDGFPFPHTIGIEDVQTGAESVLRFEKLSFDVEIPDEVFLDSEIRRRLRAGREVVPATETRPSPSE